MKLAIEIPDKDYDKMRKGELVDTILVAIKNGTPNTDDSTNGHVFITMFPNAEIEGVVGLDGLQCVAVNTGFGTTYFAFDWWNAEYKEEKQ